MWDLPVIFLDISALFPYNLIRILDCHRVVSESACLHIVRSLKMCERGLIFYVWRTYEKEDVSYLSVIICFVMFLVNDLYGFVSWKRMEQRQMAAI